MDDNEEWLSLDEDENENEEEDIRYVPHSFVSPLPPRKESNHPTDMGDGTRSLNYLV